MKYSSIFVDFGHRPFFVSVFGVWPGEMQCLSNYYELLCVSCSATDVVPTTTTGDALSLHSLHGAAGRQLDLLSAADFSCSLNEFLIPSLSLNYLHGNIQPLLLVYALITFMTKCLIYRIVLIISLWILYELFMNMEFLLIIIVGIFSAPQVQLKQPGPEELWVWGGSSGRRQPPCAQHSLPQILHLCR